MKSPFLFLVTAVLLLAGCSQPAGSDSVSGGGGAIEAINHTHWAISRFSINGQSDVDTIGPWQGGGGAGCFGVPSKWEPGMMVKVEWGTGVGCSMDFSGLGDDRKLFEWEKNIRSQNREHSATVSIPDYNGQKACGIRIHFLPYDKVKVTASCYDYGNPSYPIKDPIKMEEPEVYPK